MPITAIAAIITAVIAAAGTAASVVSSKRAEAARSKQEQAAREQERAAAEAARKRSEERQEVGDQIVTNQIDQYQKDRQDEAQSELQADRASSLQDALKTMDVVYQPSSGQPGGVAQQFAADSDRATGEAGSYAERLARLSSYDDLGVANRINMQDTWLDLNTLGNFAAGDQRRLAGEKEAAQKQANASQYAGSGWSTASSILRGVGQAANIYGSYGKSSGGGSEDQYEK